MRYGSIRDLSDDETGLVIADLKPVWLMSPLSVSDTQPLATKNFDVVIFDEASQIPLEEGVPAIGPVLSASLVERFHHVASEDLGDDRLDLFERAR